jgi:putative FmdB family regulatory protein
MPIYEYQNPDPATACVRCVNRFELIRPAGTETVSTCPECGAPVQRVVSRCRAVVAAHDAAQARAGSAVADYERQGKWSHAAELAEKLSATTKDQSLRDRALDNYKKAGYGAASLDRYAEKTTSKSDDRTGKV